MPEVTTYYFLIGIGVGAFLLVIGVAIGFILGRSRGAADAIGDKQQFLEFLQEFSKATSELSGDVSKYQDQLSDLSQRADSDRPIQSQEIQALLARIMDVNEQLQTRLDATEERLEKQTTQLSGYLTEARTDGLTGLMNRRAFDKTTDSLFAEWQNQNIPFSLGLIDIDYFKKINDTYGHQAGDEILRRLSAMLQGHFDGQFSIARYGGEEFAVLTQLSVDKLSASLEELRQFVAEARIEFEGQHIPISISCGTAEIRATDRIGNVVRRSDEALYASKLGGRNRVHQHDGTVCRLITKVPELPPEEKPAHQSSAARRDQQAAESRVQERLRRIVEEESQRLQKK